ncbi:MAG: hypothetical protein LBR95_08895 [Azoarcus sp.]|jgi:hypothetical protein|nr:hypothetical protein [Azoarcus sp.]
MILAHPFIVMDIGCLECGEPSHLVGLYASQDEAKAEASRLQRDFGFTTGQHSFEVLDLRKPAGTAHLEKPSRRAREAA